MHGYHESYFFVDFFVFKSHSKELKIFGLLLGNKFGKVLFDCGLDKLVRDLFVIEADRFVSEVSIDFF